MAITVTNKDGQTFTIAGAGRDGKSAYQIAVDNGFAGTEAEWLASIREYPAGGLEGQVLVKSTADDTNAVKWGPWPSNQNLLLNGDFRNPVNRNGQSKYTAAGYTIDRWKITRQSGGNNSITVEEGYVLLTNTAYTNYFEQVVDTDLLGKKTLTLSCLAEHSNNIVLSTSTFTLSNTAPTAGTNIGTVTTTFSDNTKLYISCYYDGANFLARIYTGNNTTFKLYAAKLEEGPIQTLAHQDADSNWILNDPPNYDLQYALCSQYSPSTGEFVGSQHSNPNLLDNAYWTNQATIINQRGQTEYTDANYTIDRWIIESNIILKLNDDKITIINTDNTKIRAQYQLLDNYTANKQSTISFLVSDVVGIVYIGVSRVGDPYGYLGYTLAKVGLNSILLPVENTYTGQYRVNIGLSSNSQISLTAAKLEEGPVQTLAHKEGDTWVLNDSPPNYALELTKCQRYLKPLLSNFYYSGWINQSGTTIHLACYYSELRATPSVIVQSPMQVLGVDSDGQRILLNYITDFTFATNQEHLSLLLTSAGQNKIAALKSCTIGCFNSDNPVTAKILLSAEL